MNSTDLVVCISITKKEITTPVKLNIQIITRLKIHLFTPLYCFSAVQAVRKLQRRFIPKQKWLWFKSFHNNHKLPTRVIHLNIQNFDIYTRFLNCYDSLRFTTFGGSPRFVPRSMSWKLLKAMHYLGVAKVKSCYHFVCGSVHLRRSGWALAGMIFVHVFFDNTD